ncbi:MAG: permease [Dictyoglomus sp. NZ13-RE01]|nr:MAG: permease [Dictyoglomus sp. NZ13-RE01]
MKLYIRYILAEVISPFLLGILGFVLVMLIQILYEFSDFIILKRISIYTVLKLLYYKVPSLLVFVIPTALLFAVIFGFSRLIRDGELFALRSNGIPFIKLTIPIFILSILLSGILWMLNYSLIPNSNYRANQIIQRYFFVNPLPTKGENIFFHDEQSRYYYVKKVKENSNVLEGVMIFDLSLGEEFPMLLTAKSAIWSQEKLILQDGIVHKLGKDHFVSWEGKFDTFQINLPQEFLYIFQRERGPQEMTTNELMRRIRVFRKAGVSSRSLEVESNLRIAQSIAIPVFTLLAFAVILFTGKSGRLWGTAFSIIIAFFYYGFTIFARSLGEYAIFSPFFSAWLPNIFLGTISLGVFLWKIRKW